MNANVIETKGDEAARVGRVLFALAATDDLSAAIAETVRRQAGDEVRCTRVFGSRYRCNWWSRARGPVPTATVRQSRFLQATRTFGELTIVDVTGR